MDHMARALALARGALGSTSPNPAVGAVIVNDGLVVGEGYTQPPGGPHAEIVALREAGERARGATVYVSLEPCCHHGRTPPCTAALIAAGVAEVRIATIDPNPRMSGKGAKELERAGIRVHLGECEEAAREINEAFFKYITTGRPFLSLKYAMTLDGKIASARGHSRWVTGPEARQLVHELRRQADAVLVGIGTVLADDPRLTVRLGDDQPTGRQPWRVVVDSRCRIPLAARLLSDGGASRTIVATTRAASPDSLAAVHAAGAEVWTLADIDGRVDLADLMERLAARGIINVLAESGGTLNGSLFQAGLVDKIYAFVAPKVVGGATAPTPVDGAGVDRMDQAYPLRLAKVERYGEDTLLVGYTRPAREAQ
ncbi:MAG: bifunctional diaminohydroxyphosphoribosylaminopyrimidine deaminase/5-amino-6-(5-phosphoribosylamino)uracil reductase RibD [Chloroflexota bacterium]